MDEHSCETSCFLGHVDKRFASEPCRGEIEEEPMKEKSCPVIMGNDASELLEPLEPCAQCDYGSCNALSLFFETCYGIYVME